MSIIHVTLLTQQDVYMLPEGENVAKKVERELHERVILSSVTTNLLIRS